MHHLCPPFFVQFLLGNPLCAAQFYHNLGILQYVRTCPKCSVASTLFSHICRFPTRPLVGCWFLLRAPCCRVPWTANTHPRIANPKHYHLPDVSHNVSSLHLLASTSEIHRVKLADKNYSHPPHVQLGSILRMVSLQSHFSKWHHFSSVVLASDAAPELPQPDAQRKQHHVRKYPTFTSLLGVTERISLSPSSHPSSIQTETKYLNQIFHLGKNDYKRNSLINSKTINASEKHYRNSCCGTY